MNQKIPDQPPVSASARATSFITSMWMFHTIRAATRYHLADLFLDGPRTIRELAAQTGTHPRSLFRLLRALASIETFEYLNPEEEDYLAARFGQSEFSRALASNSADSVTPLIHLFTAEWQQDAWQQLEKSLATGKPGLYLLTGQTPWERLQDHPAELEPFQHGMTWFRSQVDPAILASYPDFAHSRHIVDIGGGQGTFLLHVLQAYSHLTGTLFDLPSVIDQAHPDLMRHAEVTNRMQCVAGDFFDEETIPKGGDCYCLGQILQDWDDRHCLRILSNLRAVLSPSDRVLIMEPVVFPEKADVYSKFFDVQLMVALEGRTRTPREHERLLNAAGFTFSRVITTASIYSIVEGWPA